MLVVVTGCLGYIGSVLTRELLYQGYDVFGVDNCLYQPSKLEVPEHPGFTFLKHDVRDMFPEYVGALENADVIIPLAGLVGAPICAKYPSLARAVNNIAIWKLLDRLKPHQHVIYPNTNSGYGQTDGESFCTEDDELHPISVYAQTKCAAEFGVLRANVRSTVFRLATVFGPSPRMRMDLMVNDFTSRLGKTRRAFLKLEEGHGFTCEPFQVFDPHFKRNFVHVDDVVRAFVYAIENKLEGVFNLGLPTANLTKLELAHQVCDTIGLSRRAVTLGQGQDPDQRNYLVSNDKILATGFTFENDLRKGILQVYEQYQDESQFQFMRNA